MKMNSKKGFLARDWVIATILFAAVIGIFSIAVVGIANNYGRSDIVSSDFNANYNKLNDLMTNKNKMFNSVTSEQGLSLFGTFDIAFGATFTVIQLVFGSILTYEQIAFSFVNDFAPILDVNIMVMLFNVGITIITVILVFVWLSSISRGRL